MRISNLFMFILFGMVEWCTFYAINFVNKGMNIRHSDAEARNSGDATLIGSLIGVAINDIAITTLGEYAIEGVFVLPKLTSDDMIPGEIVNWNDTTDEFQAATSDLDGAATCMETTATSVATAKFKINSPGAST